MNLSAIGWPQGALGSGYPDAPKNLLPGRIEGWPQGTQSSANEAERLLSTAVAWWDADHYEDGDKILRNRGIAGDLLNLQLGPNPRVPTTNDPLYLAPEESGYVYLPGVAYNNLSVPDEAALDITGDIDIRVKVALDDWTPDSVQGLVSKFNASGGEQSFYLRVTTTGELFFAWIEPGVGVRYETSTAAPSVSNGQSLWVRVTLDVSNGSSTPEYEVKFFTSSDGASWEQLGSTITGTTGVTNIASTVAPLRVGVRSSNVTEMLAGKVYSAIVKDGINGTTVLDIDCDAITDSSQTSFQARTGQTVTINRSTSGRKSVAMPSRYIKKWDDPHVYLPGVNGNYLSVPDEAALDITGDIDIRVKVALDDWTPGSSESLISKFLTTTNQRSWMLHLIGTGHLRMYLSTNGTTSVFRDSTAPVSISDGSETWLRCIVDVDNEASGYDVKFYTSDDGTAWNQLGATVTTATATSIFSSTSDVDISGYNSGTTLPLTGTVYRAIVKDGIDGTTVLDIDMSKAPTNFTAGNSPTFLAETGQTVTLNSTANSGMEVRPARFSRGKPLFLFGTDDYMQVMNEWQHRLLNFDAGDSFTVLAVVRQWPTTSNTIIGKRSLQNIQPKPGWLIRDLNTSAYFINGDSTFNPQYAISNKPYTQINVFSGVSTSDTLQIWLNFSLEQTVSKKDVQSMFNLTPTTIGKSGSIQQVTDMEFIAAAIFRRALTPEEIATITNYYQTTAPGFQGEPEITAIDLLESSVFWIDPNISEIV